MKLFNFFKTIPPQKQQSFYTWFRISLLLSIILLMGLCSATAKLLFDYYGAVRHCRVLQSQVSRFDALATSKQEQISKVKLVSERREMVKKICGQPVNPYKYFTEVYNLIPHDIILENMSFSAGKHSIIEGVTAQIASIDTLMKKLLASPLFSKVYIDGINRLLVEKEKGLLLKFVVRCQFTM